MKITQEDIIAALDKVEEPELHASLVSLHMIQNIRIDGDRVSFDLILTTPACPLKKEIETSAREAVLKLGASKVEITLKSAVPGEPHPSDPAEIAIRNVIAIASGKGGVGKSTVAVNIAIALRKMGAKVGLLDADIYGPNTHTMMGVASIPAPKDGKIIPAEAYGIKLISIGLMVDPRQPLIWRGPMLHSAIKQFIHDVRWEELDYLIVDMPPGTGDAQISLSQIIKITAGIIVTLPQKVSVDDARRAANMFKQIGVPVIGIIENMSFLELPDGSLNRIFGEGGGKQLSDEFNADLIGTLPIDPEIRKGGDEGLPITISQPGSKIAKIFESLACEIAGRISKLRLVQPN